MNGPASSLAIRPGSLSAWRIALRPRTFPIAVIPVIVGTALAWSLHGAFSLWVSVLALAGAVLAQAISNLQNDVGYTERGGETGSRSGLPRATANGWLSSGVVRAAIVAAVVAAIAVGAPLVAYRGPLVIVIVLASIVAAYAYMGGPRPLAYTPYSEAAVFLFFGVTAVCGTMYVQAGTVGAAGWFAGAAIGLLASAVLTVNNHRDIVHDAGTGRRTLSVVLGPARSRNVYRASVGAGFALVAPIAWGAGHVAYLLPLLLLPMAIRVQRGFDAAADGRAYTSVLFRTVVLEALFGLSLAAGAIIARIA